MEEIEYWDKNGYMFPGGENGMLFALEHHILTGDKEKAQDLLGYNYASNGGEFRDDPHSDNPKMSHDNMTMIACANHIFQLGYKIPIFSKYRMHPRDIIFYGYLRYPWLFYWFMWIPSLAMIISCLQTWKIRGEQKFIKTDGKILAYFRSLVVPMPVTYWICTWIIERKEYFGSWYSVFLRYFRDPNHPICQQVSSQEYQLTFGYSSYLHLVLLLIVGLVSVGLIL